MVEAVSFLLCVCLLSFCKLADLLEIIFRESELRHPGHLLVEDFFFFNLRLEGPKVRKPVKIHTELTAATPSLQRFEGFTQPERAS